MTANIEAAQRAYVQVGVPREQIPYSSYNPTNNFEPASRHS